MTRNSKANRLGIYADVREIADLALQHNGGTYECSDKGSAVNFSHRFYRFRKLFREVHHADGSPCRYDALFVPRVIDASVHFRLREPRGVFRPSRVASAPIALAPDEDLFDVAAQIAAKLKGENQ